MIFMHSPIYLTKNSFFCRCVEIMHYAEFTYFFHFHGAFACLPLLLPLSAFLLVHQMDKRPLQEKLF